MSSECFIFPICIARLEGLNEEDGWHWPWSEDRHQDLDSIEPAKWSPSAPRSEVNLILRISNASDLLFGSRDVILKKAWNFRMDPSYPVLAHRDSTLWNGRGQLLEGFSEWVSHTPYIIIVACADHLSAPRVPISGATRLVMSIVTTK